MHLKHKRQTWKLANTDIKLQNPGLVAFYDIQPANWVGLFLKPWSPARGTLMQIQIVRNKETTVCVCVTHNMCKINIVHDTMRPFDGRQTSNSELHRRRPIHKLQQPVAPTQQSTHILTPWACKDFRPAWVNLRQSPNGRTIIMAARKCRKLSSRIWVELWAH